MSENHLSTINNTWKMHIYDLRSKVQWLRHTLDLHFLSSFCWPFHTVIRSRPEMNKSSLAALSLRSLAVLSCLYLVVHGKPASRCCDMDLACCIGRLQDSSIFARFKRRTQAITVQSILFGRPLLKSQKQPDRIEIIEESYSRAWLTNLKLSEERELSVSNWTPLYT